MVKPTLKFSQIYTRNCSGFVINPEYRIAIGLAVYTQVDESEIKTPRFGHVSGYFESGI